MLNRLIDYLQEKFPPAKAVTLLTPLVFVPASAWITGYVARTFPGLPHFDPTQITILMAAGATAAALAAYKRVDGWQKDERNKSIRTSVLANHIHAEKLKAMELESLERRTAVEQDQPDRAFDLLGLPVEASTPGATVGAAVPASPPPVAINAYEPPVEPPAPSQPVEPAAPPVPLPPQAAAQGAAAPSDPPPSQ